MLQTKLKLYSVSSCSQLPTEESCDHQIRSDVYFVAQFPCIFWVPVLAGDIGNLNKKFSHFNYLSGQCSGFKIKIWLEHSAQNGQLLYLILVSLCNIKAGHPYKRCLLPQKSYLRGLDTGQVDGNYAKSRKCGLIITTIKFSFHCFG